MNALAEVIPNLHASRWRLAAGLTLALLGVLAALFWPTFMSMVEVWERSETFTHGFLIFPISAWLIWGRRAQLARLSPVSDWRGLVLLALAGLVWLFAEAGSASVAAQYAFIAILISTVWTVLGLAIVRAIFFPLMFLFLAVPVGEFLLPPLINFTADFTVAALQLTGIPVYREGTFFSIPSGDWSVVEACSGLRYLIASITLGTLYAYLTYRSWKRRAFFTLAAIIVPVLANGARAYMIVMIAHLSNMQLALGVDHYIYGWVFFGVVMLLLFWIGSFWREDGPEIAPPVVAASLPATPIASSLGLLSAAGLALILAGVWPAYNVWLAQRALPPMPTLSVQPTPSWQSIPAIADWTPHWIGADRQFRASFSSGAQRVMLQVDYYATQRPDAELINSQNYMIDQLHPVWANVGESLTTVDMGGQPRSVRQALLKGRHGERLLVWQWNVIDGQPHMNEWYAKLILATDRISLARDDGASVLVAARYETNPQEAAEVLSAFILENEATIHQGIARVSGK